MTPFGKHISGGREDRDGSPGLSARDGLVGRPIIHLVSVQGVVIHQPTGARRLSEWLAAPSPH